MKRYYKALLPTPAMWIGFFILPSFLLVYFFASRYSDQFIRTQGIDYVAVQDNILARLYISGSVADFFTRFMDFAFWGVIATVFLLISWSFSVAKTSLQNHSIEQNFVNFNPSQKSWQTNFIAVTAIKVLTSILIIYFVARIIVSAVPMLALSVSNLIIDKGSVFSIVASIFYVILLQAAITILVNVFKITRAE